MATILVVDDEPINRELLHAYLDGTGHRVVDAGSAEAAIATARAGEIDLVLLDVMMPGMNGYDALPLLKKDAGEALLPIVLVTALGDHDSRLRGLRAGADDFLTKPVDRHELLLRVGNLLALRADRAALMRRNVELVELQRFREEMSAMLIHDLKNPLAAMLSNIDYVLEGNGQPDDQAALIDSRTAGQRLLRLLANLADVARLERGQVPMMRSPMLVGDLVDPLVRQRRHLADARQIQIDNDVESHAQVFGDAELITRVVENVFDNAFRHTPPGGRIAVCGHETAARVQIKIGNTGLPIPPPARMQIFEKFGQANGNTGRMNLGLGLYFCRLAAEAHGGRMWVEETAELPTVFGIELPAAAAA
jgi:two-component system, sensor histidine kinase and response regulator